MKHFFKLYLVLLGAWSGTGLPLRAAYTPTPTINLVSDINCGSVITGTSTGTLVLANPSGTRSATGGTKLGGSPTFFLGAFTLTGGQGDHWTLSNGGGATITLTGPSSDTMTVTYTTGVALTATTGTFPAGTANTTTTTATMYIGLTVNVKQSSLNATGTYTGTLSLKVKDSTDNKTSTATSFSITIKVDPTPITITNATGLNFGAIIATGSAGTVTMAAGASGTRSATGGVGIGSFGGTSSAASFNITGALSATYVIALPSSATLTGPGANMTVNAFTSSPSSPGTLDASGQQTLYVGATVGVAAGQTQGSYSGTFTVTVSYD